MGAMGSGSAHRLSSRFGFGLEPGIGFAACLLHPRHCPGVFSRRDEAMVLTCPIGSLHAGSDVFRHIRVSADIK
jgi:hypothetical protein